MLNNTKHDITGSYLHSAYFYEPMLVGLYSFCLIWEFCLISFLLHERYKAQKLYTPTRKLVQMWFLVFAVFFKLVQHIIRTPEVNETLRRNSLIFNFFPSCLLFSALSVLAYEWIELMVKLSQVKVEVNHNFSKVVAGLLFLLNCCLYIVHISVAACSYYFRAHNNKQKTELMYNVAIGISATQSLLFSLPFMICAVVLCLLVHKRVQCDKRKFEVCRNLIIQTVLIASAGFCHTIMFCYQPLTGKDDITRHNIKTATTSSQNSQPRTQKASRSMLRIEIVIVIAIVMI
eukprot:Pgem_evm1s13373